MQWYDLYFSAKNQDRVLTQDACGRTIVRRINNRQRIGFNNIFYCKQALEWVNIHRLFQDLMIRFNFSHLCSMIENITIAWSYANTLASVLYKPTEVFKKILLCTSYQRIHNVHAPQPIGWCLFVTCMFELWTWDSYNTKYYHRLYHRASIIYLYSLLRLLKLLQQSWMPLHNSLAYLIWTEWDSQYRKPQNIYTLPAFQC
jgi:hypothetical protein